MICAIVPARGGSKTLPGKNLRALGGRPLIAFAIEAGRMAQLVDRVIVSTDDPEIAEVARAEGAEVPFLRPPSLALDSTPTAPVLEHAVQWIEFQGSRVDATVLLQPTSPLRRHDHVDAAVRLFLDTGADSVVTLCEVQHSPHWMYRLDRDSIRPFIDDPALNRARRQDLPRLFRLNGAVYVTRRSVLMDEHRIIGDVTKPLVMSRQESLDIDDELDFEWADWLMRRATTA